MVANLSYMPYYSILYNAILNTTQPAKPYVAYSVKYDGVGEFSKMWVNEHSNPQTKKRQLTSALSDFLCTESAYSITCP